MALPTSVQKYLEKQSITFQVSEELRLASLSCANTEDSLDPAKVGKLILLQDSLGIMQVLIPANAILDLTSLCELLGRNLQALKPEDQEELLNRLGVEQLPAIPQLMEYETVIEQKLLELPEIYLHSGENDSYVRLNQEQFKVLVSNSSLCHFSNPVDPIIQAINSECLEGDEKQITQAVEQFTSLRIKQRLVNTLEIPPMPESAEKIIKLRVDPNAGIGELAKVVETDPSLAAQVVSWAASPFYAAPGKITSVHDAVVRVLGFDLVINLALGLALGKTLDLPKDGPQGVTPYWQQAVYSATTMEAMVKKMPDETRPYIGMAYLSGLLNNFGYLVLSHVFPPHFSLICRYMECNNHYAHHIIEHQVIGVSREQIASWLMSAWNMPDEIITALRWQKHPQYKDEMCVYANLLYLSNQWLRRCGVGDGPVEDIPQELYDRLGLTPELAEEAINSVMERSDHIAVMAKNLSG